MNPHKRALPFVPVQCSVCGEEVTEYAHVGVTETLCLAGAECFAWFSGYPWVLFEMGTLTTVEIMPDFPFFETLVHKWD